MKKNVGTIDAFIRFAIAIALGVFIYLDIIAGPWVIVSIIVIAAMVITGLVGWCGLYTLLGIRTCPKK